MAFEFNLWLHVGIPALIFLARVIDVSIGTIRLIFIAKGFKFLAPVLGFFEVLVWLVAIQQIMSNLGNWLTYVAYALGFSCGTFIGIIIEGKLSVGKVMIRIVSKNNSGELIHALRVSGFRVTSVDANGPDGDVKIINCIAKRQSVEKGIRIVKEHDSLAFYSVEDVRYAIDEDVNVKVKKKRKRRSFRKGK
jgi:uncharacterized protein YebE (UPF0316 family)